MILPITEHTTQPISGELGKIIGFVDLSNVKLVSCQHYHYEHINMNMILWIIIHDFVVNQKSKSHLGNNMNVCGYHYEENLRKPQPSWFTEKITSNQINML